MRRTSTPARWAMATTRPMAIWEMRRSWNTMPPSPRHDPWARPGLADDDHPQYLNLSQSETVNGNTSFAGTSTFNGGATFNSIPAFNGGTSGSTAPFTVDRTYLVTHLNADLLDGQEASAYQARVSGPCAPGSS